VAVYLFYPISKPNHLTPRDLPILPIVRHLLDILSIPTPPLADAV
jgi:hypothetical protein